MFELWFVVAGLPVPQGSKTYVPTAAGPRGRDGNEQALRSWRGAVADRASAAMVEQVGEVEPFSGAVLLGVDFTFPRPRSHYRTGALAGQLRPTAPVWCRRRPDLDKLLRALGDALTGIVLADDSQIVEVRAAKRYGAPAAVVRLTEVAE
jgi:Holliday junction resolvase RusA-like endonuclease